MIVLAFNENDQLQIVKFQKKLVQQLMESPQLKDDFSKGNIFIYRQIPLLPELTFLEKPEQAKNITSVEFLPELAVEISSTKENLSGKKNIAIVSTIKIAMDRGTNIFSLKLPLAEIKGKDLETIKKGTEASIKLLCPSLTTQKDFPLTVKIFRTAEQIKLSGNATALNNAQWISLHNR